MLGNFKIDTIRLNGTVPIISRSAAVQNNVLRVQFDRSQAVQSLGSVSPELVAYPTVQGSFTNSTDIFSGKGRITIGYYSFSGFFSPVDNLPTFNTVKAGQAIPVKFSLHGYQGLNIFAAGYPASMSIACDTIASADTVEETVTAGKSSLSYDRASDQYTYVWKTDSKWAGTCRQFVLRLNDGTIRYANFNFTK